MRRSFCSAVFCKAIWPPCLKGAGTPIGTKAYFILPLEGKWHGASRNERVFCPPGCFFGGTVKTVPYGDIKTAATKGHPYVLLYALRVTR